MRDGRLQSVKAVVQRQQGVLAEGDDDCLILDGQNRRLGLLRPRWQSATETRFFHLATVLGFMP